MHTEAANRADIAELSRRIADYRRGREDEDRFKHYRLTRGVYGQRQPGVHMFRTKIPYGRISPDQLVTLADISERYTNGRLHLTTRQNVQLHYVKLADSPAIWEELVAAGMTAREACGNTVRNVTASPLAGVDPEEPFDVSPYVQATFAYFLRNPICQEMGRKIKPAFSSSERDSAFTYFHDFGFIPRMREGRRGFKVVVGGGLGAVSMLARTAFEFLPADQILPFQEAAIRVFDRYGEREKRMKARMKFLIKQLGFDRFMELVHEEWAALEQQRIPIPTEAYPPTTGFRLPLNDFTTLAPASAPAYAAWLQTNVREQKQAGYHSVAIRVPLGNLEAEQTRLLAGIIRTYASDDVRLSVQQGMILRFVPPMALPHLYAALNDIGLGGAGYNTTADITACPGTDTCALGVTNSTGLAQILEALVRDEYPELVTDDAIRIKISGCMNACGQHMAANVGFHGSSIRVGERIAPAMQVVVGGGIAPDGRGFIAQKVIKLPTKRIPEAVRRLFDDYRERAGEGEYYNDYALRQGKRYFYGLLKELAVTDTLTNDDFHDWGQDADYRQEIGVGECAGVSLDVVGAILNDAKEKLLAADRSVDGQAFADAGYHGYTAMITAAKALLLAADVKCNTHIGILNDFATHYGAKFPEVAPFAETVLAIKRNRPEPEFVRRYLTVAGEFVGRAIAVRGGQLDKTVVAEYYKA